MNNYRMLSGRYLRHQRRRSALTVLGIVLSVALISALLTMGQALRDNYLAQTIRQYGSFHFTYSNAEAGLYGKLADHAMVDRVGRLRSGASTPFGGGASTVTVNEANKDAESLLPFHLHSGRMPDAPNEIVVEEWVLALLPGQPKPGDTLRLNALDGTEQEYALVGVLRNQRGSQMKHASSAYTLMTDSTAPDPAYPENLFVTLKKGVDISSQLPEFEQLGAQLGVNNRVLALMGEAPDDNFNRTLYIVFGSLVGLVALSTIAVIYNAFHISVLERIRQFGLLRTIGATPRQIRNLVLQEAATLAAIGIPLGLAIGWGALWLVLWGMIRSGFDILQMEDFRLTFHWWVMAWSIGVGIAAVLVAAWLPARKASRVSPVEAAKGAGSIVRESFRRARLPSPLRLLGIEGKMASTNIRRNRTKFRITTFSIVISVTLFIVFHYFTQATFQIVVDTTENDKIAFVLTRYDVGGNDQGAGDRIQWDPAADIVDVQTLERIRQLPGVEDAYTRYEDGFPSPGAIVPEAALDPDFERIANLQFNRIEAGTDHEGGVEVPVRLQLYDEHRLAQSARVLESGTADAQRLMDEDGVVIVQTVRPMNREEGRKEIVPLAKFKVGDTITLRFGDYEATDEEDYAYRQVKVAGILSQSAFDLAYTMNELTVIATKPTYSRLIDAFPAEVRPYVVVSSIEVALRDGADAGPVRQELERLAADIPGGQLINIIEQQKEARQFSMQMQIFVYCFLLVIGLIGSLNIINTVQTNLLLRRREIGLLQAVGMTMRQIRTMATAEGVWFGVIGSFWGLLLGGALCYFLYAQLSSIEGIPFAFPWSGALIACLFALGIGLVSVQGPLRRMAKANLIEELREDA